MGLGGGHFREAIVQPAPCGTKKDRQPTPLPTGDIISALKHWRTMDKKEQLGQHEVC